MQYRLPQASADSLLTVEAILLKFVPNKSFIENYLAQSFCKSSLECIYYSPTLTVLRNSNTPSFTTFINAISLLASPFSSNVIEPVTPSS